jgi:hypothetical protein
VIGVQFQIGDSRRGNLFGRDIFHKGIVRMNGGDAVFRTVHTARSSENASSQSQARHDERTIRGTALLPVPAAC